MDCLINRRRKAWPVTPSPFPQSQRTPHLITHERFRSQTNVIAIKKAIPAPRTPLSIPRSITTLPCNPCSVHELTRCSQGRPSMEKKAAQVLSVTGFPLPGQVRAGRLRHRNCHGQAPLAKVPVQLNSARRAVRGGRETSFTIVCTSGLPSQMCQRDAVTHLPI
jgi:hypothetical protein